MFGQREMRCGETSAWDVGCTDLVSGFGTGDCGESQTQLVISNEGE